MGMICETTGDKLNNVSPLNVDVKKSNGKQRSNSMPCLLIHLCLFVPLNALSFLKEGRERERVLFIGTQFSILYTFMYSPA